MSIAAKIRGCLPAGLKGPLRRFVWDQLALKWRLRSGVEVKVASEAEWILYNEIFVDAEYDSAIRETLASGRQPLIVCDLGANVGYFGLRFADLAAGQDVAPEAWRLTMIEGAPAVFRELQRRFAYAEGVRVLHGLIGERSGSGCILESHVHFSNRVTAEKGVAAPYLDLETVYGPDERIDLLKCDIEGSEMTFLRNYSDWLARVDRAVIEFHHDRCHPEEGAAIVKAAGLAQHRVLRETELFSVHYFQR